MGQLLGLICTECGCEDIRQADIKPYETVCNNCGGRHHISVEKHSWDAEGLRKKYCKQIDEMK